MIRFNSLSSLLQDPEPLFSVRVYAQEVCSTCIYLIVGNRLIEDFIVKGIQVLAVRTNNRLRVTSKPRTFFAKLSITN